MRIRPAALLWVIAALAAGACSVSSEHEFTLSPAAEPSVEAELREITEQTVAALKSGDRAFFERLLADDYLATAVDGRVVDRAHFFATFAPPPPEVKPEFRVEEIRVRSHGSVAVLNARRTFHGEVGGRPVSQVERTTQTFVRLDGRWRLLAEHSSPIAPGPG